MKRLLYISWQRDGSIRAVWENGKSWESARFYDKTKREVARELKHRYGVRCTKDVLANLLVV